MIKKSGLIIDAERFAKKYSFTYEELINEFDNYEINFYAELIELYQKDKQEFLELVASREKQHARLFKVKSITSAKANLKPKREMILNFFEQVPLTQFLLDIDLLPNLFTYEVVNEIAEFRIGEIDDECNIIPFSQACIKDDKLAVKFDDIDVMVSIQALVYFICANEMMHERDDDRAKECEDVDSEEMYVFNYVTPLVKGKFEPLALLSTLNPISAILYSTLVYKKAIRFLNDLIDSKVENDDEDAISELTEELGLLEQKKSNTDTASYANYLQVKVAKLEERETLHLKKRKELQDKLEKQKEKLDLQLEKMKSLKQELTVKDATVVGDKNAEKQLQSEIALLKQQLKAEKDERKETVKLHQKEIKQVEDKLEKGIEENKRLVTDVSNLQSQLAQEKRLKLQMEEMTFERWLEEGRKLLLILTSEEQLQLKDFLTLAENVLAENSSESPAIALATNRIGYCSVRPDGHYINFGDGQWHELKPFAQHIYLSDLQFIEVTKDLELVQALKYYYEVGPAEHAIMHFTIVEERHDKAFAKVNGQTIEIKYKEGAFILDGQVISINKNNELVSYYKNRSNTLDDLLPSIQLKGHQPLYIMMALANGYVTRTLDGVESFQQFEDLLPMHSVIVVTEDNVITLKDATGQLYKRSGIYKSKQLASVSELEEGIYVLKQNQEYVQLHDVPAKVELDLGDMVWVDEFNRFIEKVEENEQIVSKETIEQKLLNSGRKVTRKTTQKPTIEKNKNLLIIGNIRISERYKKYFGEYGYEVEVVDGTGPFEKINQACSKFDNILYSTSFTSHRNSGKLAKEVKKSFILCDSTAPRVLHYALEQSV